MRYRNVFPTLEIPLIIVSKFSQLWKFLSSLSARFPSSGNSSRHCQHVFPALEIPLVIVGTFFQLWRFLSVTVGRFSQLWRFLSVTVGRFFQDFRFVLNFTLQNIQVNYIIDKLLLFQRI